MDTRAPAREEGGGGGARGLFLMAAVAGLLAVALAGPAHQKHDRDAARVMRVGASSSNNVNNNNNDQDANNNYSVSFVPLFSLIANFLPKLLQRFAIKQTNSRSLGTLNDKKDLLENKGIFCGPESIGRWKDITDCHQYYECRVNQDSPPGCQTVLSRNNPTQKTANKDITKIVLHILDYT
ncbi:uncharacterized protein LOC103513519 [Gryllus bimaculatus]|nr:uncharacterized protein LOC103513519 [Gryllus bimaculatus]